MVDGLPVVFQGIELVGSVPLQILRGLCIEQADRVWSVSNGEAEKARPESDTRHSYSQFIG